MVSPLCVHLMLFVHDSTSQYHNHSEPLALRIISHLKVT